MPTSKTKKATKSKPETKKTSAVLDTEQTTDFDLDSSDETTGKTSMLPNFLYSKKTYIILLIIGLLTILYFKKNLFIAATVNNMPISNFEVMDKMSKQFREQTLTQIINEKIILNEARKNDVVVRKADIDQKLVELEQNVGGAEILDNLLTQQGQTRDALRDQLKIQLTIEKLYSKDASVSAEELDQFIAQNKDQLRSSDSAQQKTEATEIIKQQKLSQIFNEKFQQLKQNAKITIF